MNTELFKFVSDREFDVLNAEEHVEVAAVLTFVHVDKHFPLVILSKKD